VTFPSSNAAFLHFSDQVLQDVALLLNRTRYSHRDGHASNIEQLIDYPIGINLLGQHHATETPLSPGDVLYGLSLVRQL